MRGLVTALFAAALTSTLALTLGCSRPPASPELGTLSLHMTDAPGDFDAVHLVVEEVAAHLAGAGDTPGGWEVLNATPGTYDLLELRNGVFAELALASVPAGTYTQVRLMLGAGSTVVVDGVSHPLVIPSGLQTGLKLTGTFDVPAGGGLDIGLDFDAARSIVDGGDGTWTLVPTVRCMAMDGAGAIRGRILPTDVPCQVDALAGGDVVATTLSAEDGSFELSLLPRGSYDVRVHPYGPYRDEIVPGVLVAEGQTADIGTVELEFFE